MKKIHIKNNMSKIDKEFKILLNEILENGETYVNERRNTERLQIPSYTFRHEFINGFPALSLKELPVNQVITELQWFLSGDNDIEFLTKNKCNIWNDDAFNWHVKQGGNLTKEEFVKIGKGSVGQNYSKQWRDYNGNTDQISNLIQDMKYDIMGSRLIVNAWNPSEIHETALPPCHTYFQIIGRPLGDSFGFELHWNQRSVDTFLGLPFNIASYSALALVLQELTGYKAIAVQGDLKCVHLYSNQYDASKELITRDDALHDNCQFVFTEQIKDFSNLINAYKLEGYTAYKNIKVKMLAPIKL